MSITGARPDLRGRNRRPVWQNVLLQAAFLLGSAGAAALVDGQLRADAAVRPPAKITLDEAIGLSAREKILWIDARTSADFATNHLPGAIWLSEEAWEEALPGFVEAWKPGENIVVYCSSAQCGSSRSVAWRLIREFRATRVHYLEGGWDALQSRHL